MSSKKIVVADDDRVGRELIREVLEMSGYEVIEAADGFEAVRRVREAAPDLVLVDIRSLAGIARGPSIFRRARGGSNGFRHGARP
jgi:CheY-like chemotaxis protein